MNTADTAPISDRIIEKLQKLLNLADKAKNSSEAEADAAMALAQQLMAKYNLDMATIEANGETTTVGQGGQHLKEQMDGRAMYKWQQELMAEVANANYCRHFIGTRWYQTEEKWSETPKSGYTYQWGEEGPNGECYKKGGAWRTKPYHVLVGRQVNVVSARHMFDYLCVTIERLVPIEGNAQRLSRSAMSWKEGCGDRLQTRLVDRRYDNEREQAEQAAEQRSQQEAMGHAAGTAIAIVTLADFSAKEQDANYEVMYNLEPGTLALRRAEWDDGKEERRANAARLQAEAQAALDSMTPKERERHERQLREEQARQEREWHKQRERDQARQEREAAKRDWTAYRAGAAAGDNIGLDPQISRGSSATKGVIKG